MTQARLDLIDRRILTELQKDARVSNVQLAARVGLSPSPCLARVRRLEQEGYLKAYVALVSPEALGLSITVFIQVSLEMQHKEALRTFETRVTELPEVMECYLMTGDSDYLLRVVVPDMEALQSFIMQDLTEIPGVRNIRSSFALRQVSYKTELPLSAE
ncbi:Lrp/AsnC family transcriptional regulator [Falsigemmobacter intermedius]|uniref:Lrp/AsnC family transcriptional regulator n=1 Tax=Falsigemmobacter intermedius TaxID=1553448 RepID=A0A3S4XRK6_9RHOB|nr:Lrp/AsnC family transcriptional regulator [Falsigemmobacter intermedius]RWY40994.1 Lrp/AsnC family transcriptional regulator [Falsigemmobacter intermedius]